MNSDERIQQLEAQIAELTALVRKDATTAEAAEPDQVVASAPTSSRRNMLRLAGAAAVGTAAAVVTKTGPVAATAVTDAANAGDALAVGELNSYPQQQQTLLVYNNANAPTSGGFPFFFSTNLFLVRDGGGADFSAYPSAIGGYGYSAVENGIYGYSNGGGYGVVASGGGTGAAAAVGLLARGNKSNLEIQSAGTAPTARAGTFAKGEIVNDSNGDVWVCVVGGAPGTWRKLAGPSAAGAFHAVTPGRVYDSRAALPSAGTLPKDGSRTISVKDRRDSVTGDVVQADFVPAGATAVTANITVVNTALSGFLTVNPGGVVNQDTAAINWSASAQILNNGTNFTLNGSREITITCGGIAGAQTDFVIDVTGYFL